MKENVGRKKGDVREGGKREGVRGKGKKQGRRVGEGKIHSTQNVKEMPPEVINHESSLNLGIK